MKERVQSALKVQLNLIESIKIPVVWESLSRIQSHLVLTDAEMALLMGMTEKQLTRRRALGKSPHCGKIYQLARALGLGVEDVMFGRVEKIKLWRVL